ncbi:hypothetical protein AAG614_06120 [Citromicrobium bathyomarinum]|nr:hypothetical protein [Citromicrobium bathyomarinum]MCD1621603.1 hypothetical protein [Citromicrobium bathyomarinum]
MNRPSPNHLAALDLDHHATVAPMAAPSVEGVGLADGGDESASPSAT